MERRFEKDLKECLPWSAAACCRFSGALAL
jgi:hypothetical protein